MESSLASTIQVCIRSPDGISCRRSWRNHCLRASRRRRRAWSGSRSRCPPGPPRTTGRRSSGPTHNAVSTETKLSRTLPAAAGLGVPQGHQLFVARHCRRPPAVHPPHRRRGDRRVHGRADGRQPLAVQVRHRLRGSLRLQQRPAVQPRRGRHPRLHDGRRGEAALPGPGVGQGAVEAGPHRSSTRCRRTSSAPPGRRSSRAGCSSSTSARPAARASSGWTPRRARKCGARERRGDRATRRRCRRSCTASGASSSSPEASPRRPPAD